MKFILCVCVFIAAAYAASPPTISSSYVSLFGIQVIPWNLDPPLEAEGLWAVDEELQNSYQLVNQSSFDSVELTMYKKNKKYQYIEVAKQCQVTVPTDKFWAIFSWLPQAQDGGKTVFNGQICDVWKLKTSDQLLVLFARGQTPMRIMVSSSKDQRTMIVDFANFMAGKPPAIFWNIPDYCTA